MAGVGWNRCRQRAEAETMNDNFCKAMRAGLDAVAGMSNREGNAAHRGGQGGLSGEMVATRVAGTEKTAVRAS